jgi:hypothetical protein
MADRQSALVSLVREELGLDSDALGSPWTAAASSLAAYALGASWWCCPISSAADRRVRGRPGHLLVAMYAVGAPIVRASPVRSALRSRL